jgi:hypothetical protein
MQNICTEIFSTVRKSVDWVVVGCLHECRALSLWTGRGKFSSALLWLYMQIYSALTSHNTQINWSPTNKEQTFKRQRLNYEKQNMIKEHDTLPKIRKEKLTDDKECWNKSSFFNKNLIPTFKLHTRMRP